MSSGMNMKEAEKIAENMTYREAVMNCLGARCVPYRKATKIKMEELLRSIDNDFTEDLINQGYNKALNEIIDVVSMDIANCNTCPLDCKHSGYADCENNLRRYVLEQIKERD